MTSKWLQWGRTLQAIAQNGLQYASNPFDQERYEKLRRLAAEILAEYGQVEADRLEALFQGEVGYATPKVDVRGVVFREGQILLVQEAWDQCWSLPGGWADINESPSQAVEREVWEESGYQTKVTKVLAVYDRDQQGHTPPLPYHVYKLFFRCQIIGGSPTPSHETPQVGFFSLDNLPPLSLPRVTPAQIRRFFEHELHPDWPTDFD
ncbi:MAG: NUDIX hydrolase [Thermostichales cyanobacterium SZTDM-1c_bins_54]